MMRIEQALDFSYVVASILGGGLIGLFLLALFDRKAHARGIYAGLGAGILVTTWGTLDQLLPVIVGGPAAGRARLFPFDPLFLVTLANVASAGVGFLASRILTDRRAPGATGPTVWDAPASAG